MTCFTKPENLRVLITGAAGNIGKCLRDQLRGRYALLRLADIAEQEPPARARKSARSTCGT